MLIDAYQTGYGEQVLDGIGLAAWFDNTAWISHLHWRRQHEQYPGRPAGWIRLAGLAVTGRCIRVRGSYQPVRDA